MGKNQKEEEKKFPRCYGFPAYLPAHFTGKNQGNTAQDQCHDSYGGAPAKQDAQQRRLRVAKQAWSQQ